MSRMLQKLRFNNLHVFDEIPNDEDPIKQIQVSSKIFIILIHKFCIYLCTKILRIQIVSKNETVVVMSK